MAAKSENITKRTRRASGPKTVYLLYTLVDGDIANVKLTTKVDEVLAAVEGGTMRYKRLTIEPARKAAEQAKAA